MSCFKECMQFLRQVIEVAQLPLNVTQTKTSGPSLSFLAFASCAVFGRGTKTHQIRFSSFWAHRPSSPYHTNRGRLSRHTNAHSHVLLNVAPWCEFSFSFFFLEKFPWEGGRERERKGALVRDPVVTQVSRRFFWLWMLITGFFAEALQLPRQTTRSHKSSRFVVIISPPQTMFLFFVSETPMQLKHRIWRLTAGNREEIIMSVVAYSQLH